MAEIYHGFTIHVRMRLGDLRDRPWRATATRTDRDGVTTLICCARQRTPEAAANCAVNAAKGLVPIQGENYGRRR